MENIKQAIERIMKGEEKGAFSFFAFFLFVVSLVYGGVMKLRERLYQSGILKSERLPCKVISVGNITVGGTGKTPMVIYVARFLKRLGYKVAIVSRGYKGSAEKIGGIVSDGKNILMDAEMAGDEPYMMALKLENIPVIVGKDRFRAGMSAIQKFNPDVIILDDAFQHLRLKRDIDLVLLDSKSPFGNTHLLPRGILREPLSALFRCDAFIMTRSDTPEEYKVPLYKPIFKSFHIPYISKIIGRDGSALVQASDKMLVQVSDKMLVQVSDKMLVQVSDKMLVQVSDKMLVQVSDLNQQLNGQNLFAFSGIAKNYDFCHTLGHFNCHLAGFLEFPDHRSYSNDDINKILQSAKATKADFLVTTEKDYVRIADKMPLSMTLAVIGIDISFGDNADAFDNFIKNALI